MQPADVGNAFYRQPLFTMVRVGALERRDHAKYGGLAVFGEAMVALGHAARNLKVDHAVAQAGAPEHIQNQFFPIDRGAARVDTDGAKRSEEHTSELQSLMRISYAVFCLKKKKLNIKHYKLYYTYNTNIKTANKTKNKIK